MTEDGDEGDDEGEAEETQYYTRPIQQDDDEYDY